MIDFDKAGFVIINGVVPMPEVLRLQEALLPIQKHAAQVSGGVRNLLRISPEVHALAGSQRVRDLVVPVLGQNCFPVRAILFDKTPEANWKVPWHQDVTIAVKARNDVYDYGPWSLKSGVQHVQPPANVLEGMLSVRLHLDDCPASNGALRVIPGSHLDGKLSAAEIDDMTASTSPVTCEVRRGDALLMRPLLVHASSEASARAEHRRVIHLDYAGTRLADPLEWNEVEA